MALETNEAPSSPEEASQLFTEKNTAKDKRKDNSREQHLLPKTPSIALPARSKDTESRAIESSTASEDLFDRLAKTPFIPEAIYRQLPILLQEGCTCFESRERDVFLTAALAILSGCITTISGTYYNRIVYPNLFIFIVAPAASGKGALVFAKELAMTHHRKILQSSKDKMENYRLELQDFNSARRNCRTNPMQPEPIPPTKPNFNVLYIPGNSSSAAVIGHLAESDGIGIFCETEADTVNQCFKQEWGNFSDLFRKAFHHECIASSRKTNHEYVEVQNPRLSIALTGTPSQLHGLIRSSEDGLFSRFIYYTYRAPVKWQDVSPNQKINLTEHFQKLSERVDSMINYLKEFPTEFKLTPEQWDLLNDQCEKWLKEVSAFVNEGAEPTIKRLGLIVFRIAMILSAIRKFEGRIINKEITCEEQDLEIALKLAEVYKHHALLMYEKLPKSKDGQPDPNKRRFFESLPYEKDFPRKDALEIGKTLNIQVRTVDKYLQNLLELEFLKQPKYGYYRKVSKL